MTDTTPDYAGLLERLEESPNHAFILAAYERRELITALRTLLERNAALERERDRLQAIADQRFGAILQIATRAGGAKAERDRLAERVAELEAGLKPFAAFFEKAMEGFTEGYADRQPDDKPVWEWNDARLNMSHLRTARSLVKGGGDE